MGVSVPLSGASPGLAPGAAPTSADGPWLLSFAASPPGPNTRHGLLRAHWRERGTQRDRWHALVLVAVRAQGVPTPLGRARVTYTRRQCGRRMDWDNAGASFKLLGDALVSAGVLQDDSPEYLVELILRQELVSSRAEQGCSVRLERMP